MATLTFTLTADGQTDEFVAIGNFRVHEIGTFGASIVTLQEKQPDELFDLVINSDKTSDDDFNVGLLENNSGIYRFDLSGATGPSITIVVRGDVRSVRADI